MAFDGTEGALITLKQATEFTANHRNTMATGDIISHYFGRKVLQQLLDQPGCMGIRIYHGRDLNGNKNLVLIGADTNENDMTSGVVADNSVICPPYCPPKNGLNSITIL